MVRHPPREQPWRGQPALTACAPVKYRRTVSRRRASMDRTLRACLTEFAGTFVLVFVCTATVIAAQLALRDAPLGLGLAGLAVAQGAVLAVLLWTTSALEGGCLNPAMTLALWVTRRFDAGRALALIVVQLAAAVAAGGLAVALFNQDVLFRAQGG